MNYFFFPNLDLANKNAVKTILMKKYFIILTGLTLLLNSCGSGKEEVKDDGKIQLAFKPLHKSVLKTDYEFSVNSVTSGDITSFKIISTGEADTLPDGKVELELKNDSVSMTGFVGGKNVSAKAGGTDSISQDVRMVCMPVFSFLGKKFRSEYDAAFNKQIEVQVSDSGFVDSTENRLQFFIRYPANRVGVGESWERDILIKAGNKMNCSAKYTLKEIQGTNAIISIEGKLSGKGQSFGNEFTIDGTLTGTFTVDIATGWPTKTDLQQEFKLNLNGKEMPMKYSIQNEVSY
ncbi:MAG: hypothetical protein IAF38_08880 [Bacteroidia bacterium]|nr:hypothetical protein [Bacteroidia bacterium]